MSRRRPTLSAYVRRRWRAVGAVVVLLLGSLLVLAVTDRGHDPVWRVTSDAFDQLDVAPDGGVVYALIRDGDRISRLEARSGADGALLWQSRVNATRALLRATADGVVVATDFPLAFLTYYEDEGGIRAQHPLEGNPRALAVDGTRFALALQAPTNPVLLFDGGVLLRAHELPSFVNALDYHAGRVAVGTGSGHVVVFAPDASVAFNASYPISVRSVRLAADASALALGGYSLVPGDLTGLVAFIDLASSPPEQWSASTASGVGLIGLDEGGLTVLAVQESPPRARLSLFEGGTSRLVWQRDLEASVARDDAGAFGGVALSPDGRFVAASTLRGALVLLDAKTGATRWTFSGAGATTLTFAREDPALLVANERLLQSRPYESLVAYSATQEPFVDRAGVVAAALVVLAGVTLTLLIGVGYWRARRAS